MTQRREPDRASPRCSATASSRCIPPCTAASSRAATSPSDLADLEEHGIEPFDLVCVNLYPFAERERDRRRDDRRRRPVDAARSGQELRARRGRLRPEQYASVLAELRARATLSLETRRALAAEAFATTAAYEAAIARLVRASGESFPGALTVSLREGRRSRVRREPAPARRVLRRAGARLASRVSSCTASRSRTTTSTTSRPRTCAPGRVRRACLRDRQARATRAERPLGALDRGRVRGRARRAIRSRPTAASSPSTGP